MTIPRKPIWSKRPLMTLYILCSVLFVTVLAKRSLRSLASHFSADEIHVMFTESVTKVTATHGDVLEVATLDAIDTLTRRDSRALFDNLIYLGTTVSEIRVKVTYRYYILLSDAWRVSLDDKLLLVHAPKIRASSPPAIHTDEMQKRSEAGWLRFNAAENLEKLEQSLSPSLDAMAISPEKMSLVRDPARHAISEFVRAWILNQDNWKDKRVEGISVIFTDDPSGAQLTTPTN